MNYLDDICSIETVHAVDAESRFLVTDEAVSVDPTVTHLLEDVINSADQFGNILKTHSTTAIKSNNSLMELIHIYHQVSTE